MSKQEKFNQLLDNLINKVGYCSFSSMIEELPIFKKIVAEGMAIVPTILTKLQADDYDRALDLALGAITGERSQIDHPVKVEEAKQWWIYWGRQKGYLK